MTTEREQLELAAKACGIAIDLWHNTIPMVMDDDCHAAWNPLRSDGDCARMEAQLGIGVNWTHEFVAADLGPIYEARFYKEHNGDKTAARRAASVAVAAEIGRMK